jgi:imidazolonepropionase-like amidohydrolase
MSKKTHNLLIKESALITGDGKTFLDKVNIGIRGKEIVYVGDEIPSGITFTQIIQAEGKLVMPGIINIHAHGIIPGAPLFSSASAPLDDGQARQNLLTHVAEGTTTILNMDGFVHPELISRARNACPINIKTGLTHYPKAYIAAKKIDSSGLTGQREENLEGFIEHFPDLVVAIGEAGSGATLGGGVQDYKFIPEMVKKETGVVIDEYGARSLKEAVLGKKIVPNDYDPERVENVLKEIGLENYSPKWALDRISETVLPPLGIALEALEEGANLAKKHHLPLMVHASAPSMAKVEEISWLGSLLVAGHCNHPSFDAKEGIELIKRLRKRDVIIDVSTFDTLTSQERQKELDVIFAILESGLADVVSTDYGGGNHSPILEVLQLAVVEKVVTLPEAISLATRNASRAIPRLAPGHGVIARGAIADMVITDRFDITRVKEIIIDGAPLRPAYRSALLSSNQ